MSPKQRVPFGFQKSVRQALDGVPESRLAEWEVEICPAGIEIDSDIGGRPAYCLVGVNGVVLNVDVRTRCPADLPSAAKWILEVVGRAESIAKRSPRQLRVRHPEVAEALETLGSIEVSLGALTMLDEVITALNEDAGGLPANSPPWVAGSWAGWGLGRDTVATLFKAAAAYWRAAPWMIIGDDDLFAVERDQGTWLCSAMGSAGMLIGLAMYEEPVDLLAATLDETEDLSQLQGVCLTVIFESRSEVPREMVREIRRNSWEIADKDAVPSLMALNIPGGVLTVEHAATVTAALSGIAGAVESWTTTVGEFDARNARANPYHLDGPSADTVVRLIDPDDLLSAWGPDPHTFRRGHGFPAGAPAHPPRRYVTDLQHLLDEHGRLPPLAPEEAVGLAEYLGRIVSSYSALEFEDVACQRAGSSLRCYGIVEVIRTANDDLLQWTCPDCGESGSIANWRGSPWDKSPGAGAARRVSEVDYTWGMLDIQAAADLATEAPFAWTELSPLYLDQSASGRWRGNQIPKALRQAIRESAAHELDGLHGHADGGDPIEFECLQISYGMTVVQIVVLNRGLAMMVGPVSDEMLRLHRLLALIRELAETDS